MVKKSLEFVKKWFMNVPFSEKSPEIMRQILELTIQNENLSLIMEYFEKVFDIELSLDSARFVVKHGVDENLDEKKRIHNGLPDLLFHLAQEEVQNLPDCMTSCVMIYLPQLGYMLAVDAWPAMDENDRSSMEFPGLTFMFISKGIGWPLFSDFILSYMIKK